MKNIDYILSWFEDLSLLDEVDFEFIQKKLDYLRNQNSWIILDFEKVNFSNILFDIKLTNLFQKDFELNNSLYNNNNFIKILNILKILYLQNITLFPISLREKEMNLRFGVLSSYEEKTDNYKEKLALEDNSEIIDNYPCISSRILPCIPDSAIVNNYQYEEIMPGSILPSESDFPEELPVMKQKLSKSRFVIVWTFFLTLVAILTFLTLNIFNKSDTSNISKNKDNFPQISKENGIRNYVVKKEESPELFKDINFSASNLEVASVLGWTEPVKVTSLINEYWLLFIEWVTKPQNVILIITWLVVLFNKFLIETITKISQKIYNLILFILLFILRIFISNVIIWIFFYKYSHNSVIYTIFNYFTIFVNVRQIWNDNFVKIINQIKEFQEKNISNWNWKDEIIKNTKNELKLLVSI